MTSQAQPHGSRALSPQRLILVAIAAAVLAAAAFVVHRQATRPDVAPAAAERAEAPARPAFTAAEEQYIRELWPIHGDVQRSAMRLALGQIFYLTKDLGRAELGTRVKEALASFQGAETRLRALEPPATLRSDHEEYLSAVRLFQTSAAEVQKMFSDGRDDHHIDAAYPQAQEASDKIREVGGKFWPHEYPAH